jgi:hypothetical protein
MNWVGDAGEKHCGVVLSQQDCEALERVSDGPGLLLSGVPGQGEGKPLDFGCGLWGPAPKV